MSIYSPQRKAIYLSPNRLELLHRRRGLLDTPSLYHVRRSLTMVLVKAGESIRRNNIAKSPCGDWLLADEVPVLSEAEGAASRPCCRDFNRQAEKTKPSRRDCPRAGE